MLGDLEVEVAGELADLGGPKPRALLVAAGRRRQAVPCPVEQLIDQMWGEEPPARVEASLQSYVARLRRVLEPRPGGGRTRRGGCAPMRPATPSHLDAAERRRAPLRRPARQARTVAARTPRPIELIAEALALWRGRPVRRLRLPHAAGRGDPARRAEARRALARLWELRLARGEHAEAVAELEHLVGLHPLQERLWGLLALALYRSRPPGRRARGVRRARRAPRRRARRRPRARAADASRSRCCGTTRRSTSRPRDRPGAPGAVPTAAPSAGVARDPRRRPCSGRPASWAARPSCRSPPRAVASAAGPGAAAWSLVSGEPGIGKTRLSERAIAARGAGPAGCAPAAVPGTPTASRPLHGWYRALVQALGRTVLADGDGRGGDAASVSFRQADAVARPPSTAGRPSLLVLDDLHWADVESLRLLRRVAGGSPTCLPCWSSPPAWRRPTIGEPLAGRRWPCWPGSTRCARAPRAGRRGRVGVGRRPRRTRRSRPTWPPSSSAGPTATPSTSPSWCGSWWRRAPSATPAPPAWRARPGRCAGRRAPAVPAAAGRRAAGPRPDRGGGRAQLRPRGRSSSWPATPHGVAEALEAAQVLGLVDEEAPGPLPLHPRPRARRAPRVDPRAGAARGGTPRWPPPSRSTAPAASRSVAADLAEHYRLAGPAHARSGWVMRAASRRGGPRARRRTTRRCGSSPWPRPAGARPDVPTPLEREERAGRPGARADAGVAARRGLGDRPSGGPAGPGAGRPGRRRGRAAHRDRRAWCGGGARHPELRRRRHRALARGARPVPARRCPRRRRPGRC